MKTTKYDWLKWIGVLPFALVVSIATTIVLRLLVFLQTFFGRDVNDLNIFTEYITPIISSGAGGYAYILAGTFLAPNHKKNTGVILIIVYALLIGAALMVQIVERKYFGIIESVASLVGILIAFFEIKEDGDTEINLLRKQLQNSVFDGNSDDEK
jgi:hypothetical protein